MFKPAQSPLFSCSKGHVGCAGGHGVPASRRHPSHPAEQKHKSSNSLMEPPAHGQQPRVNGSGDTQRTQRHRAGGQAPLSSISGPGWAGAQPALRPCQREGGCSRFASWRFLTGSLVPDGDGSLVSFPKTVRSCVTASVGRRVHLRAPTPGFAPEFQQAAGYEEGKYSNGGQGQEPSQSNTF